MGKTRFGFVALLVLAAVGCSKDDPSGATSVYLTIENGSGLAVPDELRLTATGENGPVFDMQRLPASGALVRPAGGGPQLGTVTLYLGAGASELGIDVRGYVDGVALSEGTTTVGVVAGKQVSARVVLAPPAEIDGGVGDAGGDAGDAEPPADGGTPSEDGAPPLDAAGSDAAGAPDLPPATDAADAPAAEASDAAACVGSALAGTPAAPVSPVNLTTDGTVDWRHWGAMGYVDFKAIPVSLISDYAVIGPGPTVDIMDARGGLTFEWTDGAQPRPTYTNAPYSIGVMGNGAGFSFTVPATAATQALDVYVSGQNDATTFTASLGDGCHPDYVSSRTDAVAYAVVHHITFKSAAPGARLRVSWVMTAGSDPIGLYAATLH